MKTLYVLCVVMLLFTSCDNSLKNKTAFIERGNMLVSAEWFQLAPPMKKGEINFDHIVDSIRFIPLSTNDTVLVSRIDDIKAINDLFIVADYKMGRVFVFDQLGKHMGTIDDAGEGPLQYKRICSLDVDRKKEILYLLDGDLGKVYVYDLNLVLKKVLSLPYKHVNHIALYGDNAFYLEFGFREQNRKEDISPNLVLYDFETDKTLNSFFYFENKKIRYRSCNQISFSTFENNLYYWPLLGNSVYLCEDATLNEMINYDLGDYSMPEQLYFESNSKVSSVMKEKQYARVDRFYELENWYYARISRSRSSAHYFYNKKSKTGFIDLSFRNMTNDFRRIMPDLFKISDTEVCGSVSAEQYAAFLENKYETQVQTEDNPVLALYKLKE